MEDQMGNLDDLVPHPRVGKEAHPKALEIVLTRGKVEVQDQVSSPLESKRSPEQISLILRKAQGGLGKVQANRIGLSLRTA
jgi:hypothetical protein